MGTLLSLFTLFFIIHPHSLFLPFSFLFVYSLLLDTSLFFAPFYSSFGSRTDNAFYVDSPRFQNIAHSVPVQEHLCSSPRFFTPNVNSSTTPEVLSFHQFSFRVVCGLLTNFHKKRNIPVSPKSICDFFFIERN